VSRRKSDPYYSHRHCPAKRIASDANAWAERIRREAEERRASDQPAPVVIPRQTEKGGQHGE
jgi:hypothetical protein